MEIEELIKKAEEMYPAGTMVCNVQSFTKFISSGKFRLIITSGIDNIVTDKTDDYPTQQPYIVYNKNVGWAKLHPDQIKINNHESQLKHVRNIIYNE